MNWGFSGMSVVNLLLWLGLNPELYGFYFYSDEGTSEYIMSLTLWWYITSACILLMFLFLVESSSYGSLLAYLSGHFYKWGVKWGILSIFITFVLGAAYIFYYIWYCGGSWEYFMFYMFLTFLLVDSLILSFNVANKRGGGAGFVVLFLFYVSNGVAYLCGVFGDLMGEGLGWFFMYVFFFMFVVWTFFDENEYVVYLLFVLAVGEVGSYVLYSVLGFNMWLSLMLLMFVVLKVVPRIFPFMSKSFFLDRVTLVQCWVWMGGGFSIFFYYASFEDMTILQCVCTVLLVGFGWAGGLLVLPFLNLFPAGTVGYINAAFFLSTMSEPTPPIHKPRAYLESSGWTQIMTLMCGNQVPIKARKTLANHKALMATEAGLNFAMSAAWLLMTGQCGAYLGEFYCDHMYKTYLHSVCAIKMQYTAGTITHKTACEYLAKTLEQFSKYYMLRTCEVVSYTSDSVVVGDCVGSFSVDMGLLLPVVVLGKVIMLLSVSPHCACDIFMYFGYVETCNIHAVAESIRSATPGINPSPDFVEFVALMHASIYKLDCEYGSGAITLLEYKYDVFLLNSIYHVLFPLNNRHPGNDLR